MRRITKLGSVAIALLVGVPAFLSLDLFGGAEAAGEAPLLFQLDTTDPVDHIAYAEVPNTDGLQVYAYTTHSAQGSQLIVRTKDPAAPPLLRHDLDSPTTGLAISDDGTTIATGTTGGRVHLITSLTTTYDTRVSANARSPVTAIELTSDGAWLAAVTYHGDVWLYARDRLAAGEGAFYHHNAAAPAGAPAQASDALGAALGPADDAGLTLRPYSHVALAGQAAGPGNPSGLGLAAATIFGEIFLFDLSRGDTSTGAYVVTPSTYRLGNAPCRTIDTPTGPVELPCSQAAAERLARQIDPATGGAAAPVRQAVARELARVLVLAPGGLTLVAQDAPLVAFDVTRNVAPAGRQLIAAALAGGPLSLLEARLGPATTGGESPLQPVWSLDNNGITSLALSRFHIAGGGYKATLAVGSASGTLSVYNATTTRQTPTPYLVHEAPAAITHVDIARGAAGQADARDAGRWFAIATDDGGLALLSPQPSGAAGRPTLVWQGFHPFGAVGDIDVTDAGGLLAAAADTPGLALYAGLVRVAIEGAATGSKMRPYDARADVHAPDSTVTAHTWHITAVDTKTPVGPSTSSGPTLRHTFSVEGTYRLRLVVTDSFGLETSATREIDIGGLRPVLTWNAPSSVPIDNAITFDFTGTHDPDAADGGHGIARIEVHPFNNATKYLVNLTTWQVSVVYGGQTGIYQVGATAYDHDGRKTHAARMVTVTGAGFAISPEPADKTTSVRLRDLVVARDTGHTLAYGGDGDGRGRFALRDADAVLLHQEGASGASTGVDITSAAFAADASAFVIGRGDGRAERGTLAQPAQRQVLQVTDTALGWTFLSRDGRYATFVTTDGRVFTTDGALSNVTSSFSLDGTVVRAVADARLIALVLQLSDGRLVVLDGQQPALGVRDTYVINGTVTALALTPDIDVLGRAWAFLGKSNGRVETLRVQSHRFSPLGSALYQENMPVVRIAVGSTDAAGAYRLVALTRHANIQCGDCGAIHYVRSDGPKNADLVPVPERRVPFNQQPQDVVITPDARHVLVVVGVNIPVLQRYDSIWDGNLQRMAGLPARVLATRMAENGAAYLLLSNGQTAWAFAPPKATFRVGPMNHTGIPSWGERVNAGTATTFDPSASLPGDGTIIGWHWSFGDGTTSTETIPVHTYAARGTYTVRLTLTSRVTYPVDTTVVDRLQLEVRVWDPAPVAVLTAAPFNTTANAVHVRTGEDVRFDGRGSYDPGGGSLYNYRFRYGDNHATTTTQARVTYRYPTPGTFYATLTVTDNDGFTAISPQIKVIVTNRAPEAAFRYTQSERNETQGVVTEGVPVQFDGTLARDPDGQITAWEWIFSDGFTSTAATLQHAFTSVGDHEITLRVKDNHNAWSNTLRTTLRVDDGIRLRQTQDPANGANVNPTSPVWVQGFVHGFERHPADGDPIEDASVRIAVYYDGPLGSQPATTPYATVTLSTDDAGKVRHQVPFNSAGIAYEPGRYRVRMLAWQTGSAFGDTEYSESAETMFMAVP